MEVDATIPDENVDDDGDYIAAMKLAVSEDEDGGGGGGVGGGGGGDVCDEAGDGEDGGDSSMDAANSTTKTKFENGGSEAAGSSNSNSNSLFNSNKRKLYYDLLQQPETDDLFGFDEETGKPTYGPLEEEPILPEIAEEPDCAVGPPKKSRQSIEESVIKVEEATCASPSPLLTPSTSTATTVVVTPEAVPEAVSPSVTVVPAAPPPTPTATPVPIAVSNKQRLPTDDFYKKPFECGWKRELVYRANPEASKDKADIYFIAPSGKKTRSRNEISALLEGDLTIEHFCFAKEPLGAGPELEIVRSAKPTNRQTAEAVSTPTNTSSGKRISKPKAPKGASPPPQGWTATRALKNSSSLNSNSNSLATGSTVSVSSPKSTPKSSKSRKIGDASTVTAAPAAASSQPCTIQCAAAMGLIPHLQCIKCLCLYHHECVGLDRKDNLYRLDTDGRGGQGYNRKDYVCQSCVSPPLNTIISKENNVTPKEPDMQILLAALSQPPPPPPPLPVPASIATPPLRVAPPSPKQAQLIAPAPTTAPTTITTTATAPVVPVSKPKFTPPEPTAGDLPQTIAVIKGKKYVVVKKPLVQRPTAAALALAAAAETNTVETTAENDVNTNDRSKRNNSSSVHRKQHNAVGTSTQAVTTATAAVQSSPPGNSTAQPTNRDSSSLSAAASVTFASNFFANVSVGYGAILHIFKYLKIHERPRAASVCKIWNLVAKDRALWQTVRMKNSKVGNWAGFTAALRRGETKHLDLRKLLVSSTKLEETWSEFCKHIGMVPSLEHIDMCRCSAKVVESIFLTNPNLTILSALAINNESLNLINLDNLVMLRELRLRTLDKCTLEGDLSPLRSLTNLRHLSLTSIRDLGTKRIEVIGELNSLVSLELGDCNDFDSRFTDSVLPKLSNLERLRLEIGQEQCRTLDILDSVAKLENLSQLEFVNFDIKPGFDDKLAQCTNILKLLIIPTYISQSATTNNIVLNAVLKLQDTLEVFTWGVTVELLRVTALYVDQCEDSTRKERHHFDECIPVLKPVPGSSAADTPDNEPSPGANAVPQIEILPLDKVEEILRDNLATTKFTIVKVPYHATWKQQLVE
ncbi:uncharacterized protein LOC129938845 isoform X1 [Eupeodes corollae]|uniref:uncharacterized protein LOC129938845 isoform X1 n=1 Tax=Eupeodes corollae TaxID=290404 RepID=UPI002493CB12|nr:uncharacterized protein LOC129938845 isoform X1 [Eupeodes corollae]